MKGEKTMKIQSTKSPVTFEKTALVHGIGLGNLNRTIGVQKTEEFINKLSNAAKQISGKDFYFLNRSQIVGDTVTLKGKYVNNKSVERFLIALNLKANTEEIQKELEKETSKLKLVNIFDS